MHTTEISVTTTVQVNHRFAVGDVVRSRGGCIYTVTSVALHAGIVGTGDPVPVYRYGEGGWDFISLVDETHVLVLPDPEIGQIYQDNYGTNEHLVIVALKGDRAKCVLFPSLRRQTTPFSALSDQYRKVSPW